MITYLLLLILVYLREGREKGRGERKEGEREIAKREERDEREEGRGGKGARERREEERGRGGSGGREGIDREKRKRDGGGINKERENNFQTTQHQVPLGAPRYYLYTTHSSTNTSIINGISLSALNCHNNVPAERCTRL